MTDKLMDPRIHVHGELNTPLLFQELVFSLGRDVRASRWRKTQMKYGGFLVNLANHVEGPKDGSSIVLGELADGRRRNDHVVAVNLVGIDMDNGFPIDLFIEKVVDLKLACAIATTHSHGKTTTEVALAAVKGSYGEDPPADEVLHYLVEHRKVHASVLTDADVMFDAGSETFFVEHKPMAKYRAFFPLARPVTVSTFPTRLEAKRVWRACYELLISALGVEADDACKDMARAFYLPRHAPGAEWEVHYVGGAPVHFDARLVEAAPRVGKKRNNSPCQTAGEELQTPWLKRFLVKNAQNFDASSFFGSFYDERGGPGSSIHCFECPNDHHHSNAGDPHDSAFYTISACESDTGSFVAGCHHNACSKLDRANFLDIAITTFDLTEDDLFKYCVETWDEEEQEVLCRVACGVSDDE